MEINKKEYIGDGVYVYWDGYHLVLETDNGQNRIFLDSSVRTTLRDLLKELPK